MRFSDIFFILPLAFASNQSEEQRTSFLRGPVEATGRRVRFPEAKARNSRRRHGYRWFHRRNTCRRVGARRAADDLGYRFNKWTMDADYRGQDVYLDWNDYPLQTKTARALKNKSTAFSVVTKFDYEVKGVCIENYIQAVGGYPTMPSGNSNSPFWDDFKEVVDTQIMRAEGILPDDSKFVPPDLWKDYSASEVAEAVHDEYPGSNHQPLLEQFIAEGIELDYSILPFRSKIDFIGTEVRLSDMNTWAIGAVAPINFLAKWHVGRPRPEEVAWLIRQDEITVQDGADPEVVNLVKSMGLTNATSFTQYPEGSPGHPAWPAMHSAASSASLWLAVIANLTKEQFCQVLRMDHGVAYARTVAGVHYPTDNIAGLNMGQEVMANQLPKHLAKKYGSNVRAVKNKIRRMRFDWNTYSPEDCTVEFGSSASAAK